jgi:hypothetical protein
MNAPLHVALYSANGGGVSRRADLKYRFLERRNKGNRKGKKETYKGGCPNAIARVVALVLFVLLVIGFLVAVAILRRLVM